MLRLHKKHILLKRELQRRILLRDCQSGASEQEEKKESLLFHFA
jgi:hypothetical protein